MSLLEHSEVIASLNPHLEALGQSLEEIDRLADEGVQLGLTISGVGLSAAAMFGLSGADNWFGSDRANKSAAKVAGAIAVAGAVYSAYKWLKGKREREKIRAKLVASTEKLTDQASELANRIWQIKESAPQSFDYQEWLESSSHSADLAGELALSQLKGTVALNGLANFSNALRDNLEEAWMRFHLDDEPTDVQELVSTVLVGPSPGGEVEVEKARAVRWLADYVSPERVCPEMPAYQIAAIRFHFDEGSPRVKRKVAKRVRRCLEAQAQRTSTKAASLELERAKELLGESAQLVESPWFQWRVFTRSGRMLDLLGNSFVVAAVLVAAVLWVSHKRGSHDWGEFGRIIVSDPGQLVSSGAVRASEK